jgi:hypothetical protein
MGRGSYGRLLRRTSPGERLCAKARMAQPEDAITSAAIVRLVRVRGDICSTPGAYHFCNSRKNEAVVQASGRNVANRLMASLRKIGNSVFTLLAPRNEGGFEGPRPCEKCAGGAWSGCWNGRYEIDSTGGERDVLARNCG